MCEGYRFFVVFETRKRQDDFTLFFSLLSLSENETTLQPESNTSKKHTACTKSITFVSLFAKNRKKNREMNAGMEQKQ